ncbi:MAG: hypothetical protein KGK07_15195 [Chloroflexota bacterium]|nr:hypothetical protein [Chloroflexota bacterium]
MRHLLRRLRELDTFIVAMLLLVVCTDAAFVTLAHAQADAGTAIAVTPPAAPSFDLWAWFTGGSPAHWQVLALVAYIVLSEVLAHAKSLNPNSPLQLLMTLLRRTPLAAKLPLGVLLVGAVALSGCACWHPTDPAFASQRCVIARQSVDCTTASAKGEIAPGIAVAKTIVDSGTVDVVTIEAALISLGFHDAQCVLAALASDFSRAKASPGLASGSEHNRALFLDQWQAHVGAPQAVR